MSKRAHGVTDAMVKVFESSDRPFFTSRELAKLVIAIVPEAKRRTIEVMLTRDFVHDGLIVKTCFKTQDFNKGDRKFWLTIYAWKKAHDERSLGDVAVNKHYKVWKRVEPTFTKKVVKDKLPKEKEVTPQQDVEISDVEFGRKIISYISELKNAIGKKDDEMTRVMHTYKAKDRELKNTISQLNKKLTSQNELIENLQSKFKIRKKDPDKVFKLSEVAHIK